VTFRDAAGKPLLAIVVEVQRCTDYRKKYSWPEYVTKLRSKLECDVILLVICDDPAIARWSGEPIKIGPPGMVLTPFVVGPGVTPVITDLTEAVASPELAAMSAIAHGDDEFKVLDIAYEAFASLGGEEGGLYSDYVLARLGTAEAKRYVETLMTMTTSRYESEFFQNIEAKGLAKGLAEGKAEGLAEAIFDVFEARDLAVSDEVRERVLACPEPEQLQIWIRRAVTVDSAEQLFS
jgi:hypothetical protein